MAPNAKFEELVKNRTVPDCKWTSGHECIVKSYCDNFEDMITQRNYMINESATDQNESENEFIDKFDHTVEEESEEEAYEPIPPAAKKAKLWQKKSLPFPQLTVPSRNKSSHIDDQLESTPKINFKNDSLRNLVKSPVKNSSLQQLINRLDKLRIDQSS